MELVALRGETLDLLRHRDVLPDPRRGWPQLDHSAIYHVPAMIRIQRLIPAAAERDNPHFSLSMRFLEGLDADESPRLYSVANDSWVLNRRGDFDKEAFKHVVHGTQLERLHELTESDPKLRENVRDFVARLIDYSNETRMLTDFGGDGNVVFDGASYHLIDAFYGMPNVFDDAERALGQIGRGEAISPQDRNKTFFSVNYIRALNAVAHALGIEKRVELVRSGKGHQEPNWDHVRSALRPPDPSVKKESSSGESAAVFFPVPFQPW
ncbi:hypothetical protein [Trinickia acidisoli]|uniref:hypothetical protein n=1 Tax=Trinickia acidisoli TaxID=2767482 RepID=UPI001A90B32E|nr:hypothetical protein [Trinickia acidisoli]